MISARHAEFANFVEKAVEKAAQPKDLASVKKSISQLLSYASDKKKCLILEQWSDPAQNSLIWRAMDAKDLAKIAFRSDDDNIANSVDTYNKNLFTNCTENQLGTIKELLIDAEAPAKFELAQLK